MNIVKSLEDSGLLIKGFTQKIEKEIKEKRGGFLGMPLGKLVVSLLGDLLTGKGVIRAGDAVIRAENEILKNYF